MLSNICLIRLINMNKLILLFCFLPILLFGQSIHDPGFVGSLRIISASGKVVSVLGRLENSTDNTVVTATIADNGFIGDTDGTWSLVNAGGSGQPTVQTVQDVFVPGLQLSDGSGYGDSGTRIWEYDNNTDVDIYPKYTFTSAKSSFVFGYCFKISGWSGATFGSYDSWRVGQSPYCIVNFDDNFGIHPKLGCHTPDGVGNQIAIDNDVWYWITGIFRPGDASNCEFKVYVLSDMSLVGTSVKTSDPGTVDHIRFCENDNHGNTGGGKFYYDNFCWTYSSSDYPLLPQ